jgi:hypothetical protein
MFKVTITNENAPGSPWIAEFETETEARSWLDKQKTKPHRLPEREIPESGASEEELNIKLRTLDANESEPRRIVLPAQATYVIEDLTQEKAAVAYIEERRKAYPSWEVVMEALIENMEGRPEKLEYVKDLRAQVRNDYPKPGQPKIV